MNTPEVTEAATALVRAWVDARKSFSAFDVTLALRQHGALVEVSHDTVREVVHQLFEQGALAGYGWQFYLAYDADNTAKKYRLYEFVRV